MRIDLELVEIDSQQLDSSQMLFLSSFRPSAGFRNSSADKKADNETENVTVVSRDGDVYEGFLGGYVNYDNDIGSKSCQTFILLNPDYYDFYRFHLFFIRIEAKNFCLSSGARMPWFEMMRTGSSQLVWIE